MKIDVLGAHNFESRDTRLVSLLVDESLVLDAGALTSSLSFVAQRKLRAVLLTHQHYDHIRDVLTLAMNYYVSGDTVNIYTTLPVCDTLTSHMINGRIYPDFLERPPEKPTVKFTVIEPYQTIQIDGYSIMAVPVAHSVPTVGYQITSPDGKVLFYTGDTGPGLADCWEKISPELLIIELTATNWYEEFGRMSGHLTPGLLKQELGNFKKLKGYLPMVVTVHMSPELENDIAAEIEAVANDLDIPIILGYEGMQLYL